MQENKKNKKKFTQLCRRPALGKAGPFLPARPSFGEGRPGTRQSDQTFAECRPSAKSFFLFKKIKKKKKKIFVDGLPRRPPAKNFSKKKRKNFVDGLTRQPSAKASVRVTARGVFTEGWRGRRQRLCRRSAMWPSAKVPLPSNSLPTVLCRRPE